ncbi:MAG: arginine--tRNA ligase [Candidatus Daviesbacteria bacterium]
MIKQKLEENLKRVIERLGYPTTDIILSISRNSEFGDYSSNIALQLAKLKSEVSEQTPAEIANEILEELKSLDFTRDNLSEIKIAGQGFLNFFIKKEFWQEDLKEILKEGKDFGKNDVGSGKKIQVEFISANPTGPLTLANGRGGAVGDTLANVLSWSNYLVNRQFYVNNTGNQIRMLGESVLSALGKFPSKEEHYKGEYIKELAEIFKKDQDLDPLELGEKVAQYLLEHEIKPAIERLGVNFNEFYSEKSVYERDLIKKTAELLKEKGLVYEKEGALWFKASEFGDEKDRVLITSEEARGRIEPTYFLADVAHHLDDLEKGYVKRINLLGADHHGYGERIKGVMEALGFEKRVEIIFFQFVRLFKGGKEVRMSKRAGNFVTLDELLEAVGKDVARFFFLMYSPDSHIDFNLDLAKEKSEKNPVYYVQYAHARMANILKKAENESKLVNNELLTEKAETNLIRHLISLPDLVREISDSYQVQHLTTYAITLADLFHRFYEQCPVLGAESEKLKEARLALVFAGKIVLGNVLKLLEIEAPERM